MRGSGFVAGVAALALGSHAYAEPFRVTYAEPLWLQSQSTSAVQKAGAVRQEQLAFDAFGHRFELELEENAKVLSGIEPSRLAQLRDLTLFRGKVRGQPDSWVRLSLMKGQYTGAIWDGAELYSIEPRSTLRSYLVTPSAGTSSTLIYRLSDTQGGVIGGKCGTGGEIASATRSQLAHFKAFLGELKDIAALVGTRELVVAVLADQEFASYFGDYAFEAMLARMNIVDGIFDYQVDVNVIPADFRTFSAINSPFTSNDPEQLLFQVGDYRSAAPQNRTRGLTHLLTGKPLNGQTLGIAYINALCSNYTGVGLSQEQYSETLTAMVIAHELGHNFGADHDGVPGSVCSSTPQTFLMSPFLGSSTTFSQCSRDSIAAHVAGASCVTPARTRDLRVTAPVSIVTAIAQEEFEFVADIESIGEASALNILVYASTETRQVVSASIDGGSCTFAGGDVSCEIAELAPGTASRLRIIANAGFPGSATGVVTVSSSAEQLTTNNSIEVPIEVYPRQSASISFSPETIDTVSDEPFDIAVTIENNGITPLIDATARFGLYNFTLLEGESEAGPCAFGSDGYFACPLGTLAVDGTVRIDLRLSASATKGTRLIGSVSVQAGAPPPVNIAWFDVNVRPLVDLEIEPLPSRTLAVVGETVTFPLVLRSVGTQAVADARITIDTHPLLGLEVVGSGADCSGSSGVFECSFGTLESGAEVGAQLRVRSDVALWAMVQLHAHPDSGDEVRDNSSRSTIVEIRQAVDVQVGSPNVSFQAREGMERTDMLWLTSVGAYAATDVEARIELPEGVTAVTAYMEEGECTIADRLVRCSIDELSNSSRTIELTYVGAEPGTFSGSFTVSANDDADASNNSAALTFEIIPNTDAAVVLPEDRHAFIDDDRDWVISVVNNRYALPDSSLRVDINPFGQPDMTIVSAVPSKGTCAVLPVLVSCNIGTLDPNEVFTVSIRTAWSGPGTYYLYPTFYSLADLEPGNNDGVLELIVDNPADVSIDRVDQQAFTVDTRTSASIVIATDGQAEDSFVELDFDRDVLSNPEIGADLNCDWTVQPARCKIGTLSGERSIQFSFTPRVAGNTALRVRVGARNDRTPGNNERAVTLSINPRVQTSPNPPNLQPSGGGKGGGGAMHASYLLGLLLLALVRLRRERRAGH